MTATAAVLLYARTPGGVVQVDADQALPDDVLPDALERLVKSGAAVLTDDADTAPAEHPAKRHRSKEQADS